MSAAIRIQAPPPPSATPPPDGKPVASSSKAGRLCRNTLIYGFCKYENDGCAFDHPSKTDSEAADGSTGSPAISPVVAKQALSVVNAAAPAFVPRTAAKEADPTSQVTSPTLSAATPAFVASAAPVAPLYSEVSAESFSRLSLNAPTFNPVASHPHSRQPSEMAYEDVEQYYPPQRAMIRQPLDYHLYTSPLPHVGSSQSPIRSFFLSSSLREDLQKRSAALYETSPVPIPGLPESLHVYHSLHPLEPGTVGTTGPGGATTVEKSKRVFGLATEVYKAMSEVDGNAYVLRRVEGFKIMHDTAFSPIESWRRIRHPNVIFVREAFTTRAFGDHSVMFAYDYHPTSRTLYSEHFTPKPPAMGKNGRLQPQEMHVPERILWSYITQLANALKAIHSEGLAARMVEPSKILVTGKNRIRINCCGILDVVAFDGGQSMQSHQQEDLLSLGKLILALTNLSLSAVQNLPKALEILSRSYSNEVKNLVMFLLSKPGPMGKTIDEVLGMLGPRLLNELDASQNYSDVLESEMTRELENGRLVRLLCKFGFINERPEFDHDPRWSESGDRYILKLFRDMVFHQLDELGRPVLDLSHVLTCLNKLDAGSDEKVMLMSRDEQSCLVVSYREIKACVDAAFNDLARATS